VRARPDTDQYLLALIDTPHSTALRREIAAAAECSPFLVRLTPVGLAYGDILFHVELPRSARHSPVTDLWPMGRVTMFSGEQDRIRLISAASFAWMDVAERSHLGGRQIVPFGDPPAFYLDVDADLRRLRFVAPDRPPPRRDTFFCDWAQSWLSATLSHSGWNVTDDGGRFLCPSDRAIV
jgi:hypothetical protein